MNAITATQVFIGLFISALIGFFTKNVEAGLLAAGFLAVSVIILRDAKDAAKYHAAQQHNRF